MRHQLLLDTGNPDEPFLITGELSTRSKELTTKGIIEFVNNVGASVAARVIVDPRTIIVRKSALALRHRVVTESLLVVTQGR